MGDIKYGRERERGDELRRDAEAREVLYSIGQFNHNHLDWIIRVEQENINSERETNGTHFRGVFNPFQ